MSMTATTSDLVSKEKADEIAHALHVDQSPSPEVLHIEQGSETETQLSLYVLFECKSRCWLLDGMNPRGSGGGGKVKCESVEKAWRS